MQKQPVQLARQARAHIEEYLQNAAAKKKELDKGLKATFVKNIVIKD